MIRNGQRSGQVSWDSPGKRAGAVSSVSGASQPAKAASNAARYSGVLGPLNPQ